mgnify:CR=1 FL=1
MARIFIVSLLAQLVIIALFLYWSWQAEQFMCRSGIADCSLWQRFNELAGMAFYSAVCAWLFTTVLSVLGGVLASTRLTIALPPVFLFLGWLLVLII